MINKPSTQLCLCKCKQPFLYSRYIKVDRHGMLMLPPEDDNNSEQPNNNHIENSKSSIKKDQDKLIKIIRKNLAKLKATIAISKKPR